MKKHEAYSALASATFVLAGSLAVNHFFDPAPVVARSVPAATFTFDALGGSSNEILVYPSPGSDPEDRVYDGIFLNGQSLPLICQMKGRMVRSIKGQDDRNIASHMWAEVLYDDGQGNNFVFWATEVYGHISGGPVETCT